MYILDKKTNGMALKCYFFRSVIWFSRRNSMTRNTGISPGVLIYLSTWWDIKACDGLKRNGGEARKYMWGSRRQNRKRCVGKLRNRRNLWKAEELQKDREVRKHDQILRWKANMRDRRCWEMCKKIVWVENIDRTTMKTEIQKSRQGAGDWLG